MKNPEIWKSLQTLFKFRNQAPSFLEYGESKENIPLSFFQERLWLIDRLRTDELALTLPQAFRITGNLNILALEKSLNEIRRRHEILRTSFELVNDQPVQIVEPFQSIKLTLVDLSDFSEKDRESKALELINKEVKRTFNLSRGQLFHSRLLKLNALENILLLTCHHIIWDAKSRSIFFQELTDLYRAFCVGQVSPLPELSIQYSDFALWQREWLQREFLHTQLSYWEKQLQDLPQQKLPTDYLPAVGATRSSSRQTLLLSNTLTKKLKLLSDQEGVTLFITFLAAFKLLLRSYLGQYDLFICTPIDNRSQPETKKLLGYFVNLVIQRTNLSGNPSFQELLGRVCQGSSGAYAHQDLPIQELVKHLKLTHLPLSQILFSFIHTRQENLKLDGLSVTFLEEQRGSDFDLFLSIEETNGEFTAIFKYKNNLFREETIRQMLQDFQIILEGIVANPQQPIDQLLPLSIRQPEIIEKALKQHPKVQESIVFYQENIPNYKYLVAYILPSQEQVPEIDELQSFLKQKLPNYRLPADLLFIERVPLRADGSIDREALIEQTKAKLLVLPRNEYEFRLHRIWQQVLNTKSISIDDNFFELGGNSLLAANLLTKIAARFGQKLPFSALSEASTIEQLAKYMKQPDWSSALRSLVPIKPQGTKRPLFFVHPRSGTVTLSGNLARYLDPERPFYGLQSIGLNGAQEPLTQIEDMAAHYIKEIQTVQPQGPYLLGGRCLGGKIAFEMAQQLLIQGQQVLLVVMVDSRLSLKSNPKLAKNIENNINKIEELNFAQANSFQKVMKANDLALAQYDFPAKVYPGAVAYFCGQESLSDPLFNFGWSNLITGRLDIYEVSGDHKTIDEEPNIQILAEKLNNCLNKAELDSPHFNTHLIQGYIQHQQGHLRKAIANYQQALTLEPDNPQIYRIIGKAQKQRVDLEGAIASYRKAIELEPQHYWYYYQNLAEIFKQQGKIEATITTYSQAISAGYAPVHIYICLAEAQEKNGDLAGAIANYQQALALNPANFFVYRRLGQIQLNQGDLEQASKSYKKAISLKPSHPKAYNSLGNVQLRSGNIQSAIASYKQAIALNPKQPFAVYKRLGDALSKEGEIDDAIAAYEKALALKLDNKAVIQSLTDLKITSNDYRHKKNCSFISTDKSSSISSVRKVDFLIMGTQKGGTTALASFLSEHPQIGMASRKEVHFFDNDKLFSDSPVDYEVYHQYFADVIGDDQFKVIGEATPIYMYWKNSPQRIAQYNPKIKLIFILRNPIDRAYSHWMMNRRQGLESLSFTEAIRVESQRSNIPEICRFYSYVDRGYYSRQIKKIRKLFATEQMLFLKNEDLKFKHDETINRICDFLEVKRIKLHQSFIKSYKYQPINKLDQQYLSRIYQEELNELESLLNWDCSDWKNSCLTPKENSIQQEDLNSQISIQDNNTTFSALYCKTLAQNNVTENNLKSAINLAQETIKLEPKQAAHYFFLGNIYLKHKDLGEAIKNYQKAIKLGHSFFWTYQKLGYALSKKGQIEEAIVAYNKAINLQPDEPILHFELGKIQQQQEQLDAAILNFEKACSLAPNYMSAYQALGHAQFKLENFPEAIDSYEKAIILYDKQPFLIYKRLGYALRQEGKIAKAISAYRLAFKLRPDNKAVLRSLTAMEPKHDQTVVCILGMHRSGTSCLAGSLQAGDLFAGKVVEYSTGNIKGHRENQKIITINEQILASNHGNADNPPQTIIWTKEQKQQRDQLITEFYEHSPVWMFKDPRTLLTLPFWTEGIPNIKFIGTFRHPLAVAMSLSQRSRHASISLRQGVILWIEYNQILLKAFQQAPFPLICFDLPRKKYLEKLEQIIKELNAQLPEKYTINIEKSLGFYQSQLIHQHQINSNYQGDKTKIIEDEDHLMATAEELYQNLRKAAGLDQDNTTNYNHLVPLEETIEACQEIISLQPNNDNAYYLLGNAQRNEGKLAEAVSSYRKAIELAPNNFYYYRNLGDILSKQGKIAAELGVYNQALKLQPDNFQIYYLLGKSYAENNNLELATLSYQKAIDFAPDYYLSYLGLGKIFVQQNQLEKAIQLYKKALDIKPNHNNIHSLLGDAYWKQNDLDNALVNYQKARSLNQENKQIYLKIGNILSQQDKVEAAIVQFQEAIRLNPDYSYSYILLGKAFWKQNNLEAAIAQYQKAIELDPNNSDYYNVVGNMQNRLGHYEAAISYYQSSLELNPQQVKTYISLGNVLSKTKDTEKAFLVYKKALELEPNNQKILDKLVAR